MSAHAFLPPSGASSWSKCALWPTMNARFPQLDSAEAVEGTAAHWTAWEMFLNGSPQQGTVTPDGTIVTDEMLEGAELVVDTIQSRTAGMNVAIERGLDCVIINSQCWGTPDAWAVSPDLTRIEIFDYKFGHRFVDEFWNPQGLCYLAGILDKIQRVMNISPSQLEPVTTVSFTVIQPRCFYRGQPVRTHTFRLSETREYFNALSNAAEAALLPTPAATTNDHCGDCPGRHSCTALQQAAYSDAEFSNQRAPVELTPTAAALELRFLMRALARLEARVDGLKELTIANMRAGKIVPYFRVEPGFGRTTWKIPDAQVIAMGELYGANLSKAGVVTPKQAEKAGIDPAVVQSMSFTPSTAYKLVAQNPTDAPRVFGNSQE